MIEIGENLVDGNLPNLCRLCLQIDDFIVDIFHRLDPNPKKKPLPERIYDLYQIKVQKSDGLPTNICHRCLYFTEMFSEFRENVRKCEARLQKHLVSIGILGSEKPLYGNNIKREAKDSSFEEAEGNRFTDISPEDDSFVMVVDPNQEYESSDEEFSLDESDEPQQLQIQHENSSLSQLPSEQTQSTAPSVQISNAKGDTNETSENKHNNDFEIQSRQNSDINKSSPQPLSLRNTFLCQYCDMAFVSKIDCAEHESRHDAANPYSCNYCPFRCATRQIVIHHIKNLHDNERPFACVQCNKTFMRRSDLKKHTIVHTGTKPFACSVCGKTFSRNTNLSKHLLIHTGIRPFVCQKCPRSFISVEDLHRHEKVHLDQKKFQCTYCPLSFSRKDKLANHIAQQHTIDPNKTLNVHKQSELQQIYPSYQQQQQQQPPQHQQISEYSTALVDPYCNFRDPKDLTGQENVNGKSPLVMTISKKLPKNNSQQKLQASAQDQNPAQPKKRKREIRRNFICPVCSQAFLRQRELERHSLMHAGIKPFSCRYCPKRFNRKDKATRHEKSHQENQFSCSHCQMVFSKQEALDAHLRVHELDHKILPTAISQHFQQQQQRPLPQQLLQPPSQPQQLPSQLPPVLSSFYGSQYQQQFTSGMPQAIHFQQQQQQQQQHPHVMMAPQQQPVPLYQGFQHMNYRPPQLNFYNEIQNDPDN